MAGVRRIVCALSGSVDSAVVAHLLKRKGLDVIGLFIKNGHLTEGEGINADRAEYVCRKLQIPFRQTTLNAAWQELTQNILESYEEGKTPNIETLYQHHMIFKGAMDFATDQLGAEYLATGHYARTEVFNSANVRGNIKVHKLLRGVDQFGDDSFYLAQCSQDMLQKLQLPLGDFTKDVIPKIAQSVGLGKLGRESKHKEPVSHSLKKIVCQFIPQRIGSFVDLENKKLIGKHQGAHNYHIGQQLTIGDHNDYFVAEKNCHSQEVHVVRGNDHTALYVENVFLSLFHWVSEVPYHLYIDGNMECDFKIYPQGLITRCSVVAGRGSPWCGGDDMYLTNREPLRAMIPGHYVVAYRGDECLGSARVLKTGPSIYAMNQGKHNGHQSDKAKEAISKIQNVLNKFKPS